MQRLLTFMAMLVATTLVITACGGGDEDALLATGTDDPSTNVPTSIEGTQDPAGGEDAGGGTVEGITDDPTGLDADKIQGDTNGKLDVFTPLAQEGTIDDVEVPEEFADPGGVTGAECNFFGCGESTSGGSTSQPAQHDQARITVDGSTYNVVEGSRIPDDSNYFTVSSISTGSIVLSLTTGEFATGAEGITLTKGETIELQNQSEDLSYTVTLVSTSASEGSSSSGSSGSTGLISYEDLFGSF